MESPDSRFSSSFEQGHANYNRFKNRLEDAETFDDVLAAIKDSTVTDEEGVEVVFDVANYKEENEEVKTVPVAELLQIVQHLAEQGATHADDVLEMTQHSEVASAVSRIIFKAKSNHDEKTT